MRARLRLMAQFVKKLPFDSLTGLFLEVVLLLPLMLVYFIGFANSDASNLLANTWQLNSLLVFAGIITTVPLLFFTGAAKADSLLDVRLFPVHCAKFNVYLGGILVRRTALRRQAHYLRDDLDSASAV